MNVYPRETVEFLPVTVTVDGAPLTTGVEFTVTTDIARPANWAAPTVLEGAIGVMITGLAVGTYRVWAKVTDSPEIPVIECGAFRVT